MGNGVGLHLAMGLVARRSSRQHLGLEALLALPRSVHAPASRVTPLNERYREGYRVEVRHVGETCRRATMSVNEAGRGAEVAPSDDGSRGKLGATGMAKGQKSRSDRWLGWPYPGWLLVALLAVLGVLAVSMSVASVRYNGSMAVEELVRRALLVPVFAISTLLGNWLNRRWRR